jgi:hypothetical protein
MIFFASKMRDHSTATADNIDVYVYHTDTVSKDALFGQFW